MSRTLDILRAHPTLLRRPRGPKPLPSKNHSVGFEMGQRFSVAQELQDLAGSYRGARRLVRRSVLVQTYQLQGRATHHMRDEITGTDILVVMDGGRALAAVPRPEPRVPSFGPAIPEPPNAPSFNHLLKSERGGPTPVQCPYGCGGAEDCPCCRGKGTVPASGYIEHLRRAA